MPPARPSPANQLLAPGPLIKIFRRLLTAASEQSGGPAEAAAESRDRRHKGMAEQRVGETHGGHQQNRAALDEAESLISLAGLPAALNVPQSLEAELAIEVSPGQYSPPAHARSGKPRSSSLTLQRLARRRTAFRLGLAESDVLFIRHA
jgi:hypothetical protein